MACLIFIFLLQEGYNKLYLNQGNFKFQDITLSAGVDGGEGIKTGVNMVDINDDGYLISMFANQGYKDPLCAKKCCTSITTI
jgi:hypothetical protein